MNKSNGNYMKEEADPVIIIHGLLDALKWVSGWKDFYTDPIKKATWQKLCNPAIEEGKDYIRGLRTQ